MGRKTSEKRCFFPFLLLPKPTPRRKNSLERPGKTHCATTCIKGNPVEPKETSKRMNNFLPSQTKGNTGKTTKSGVLDVKRGFLSIILEIAKAPPLGKEQDAKNASRNRMPRISGNTCTDFPMLSCLHNGKAKIDVVPSAMPPFHCQVGMPPTSTETPSPKNSVDSYALSATGGSEASRTTRQSWRRRPNT